MIGILDVELDLKALLQQVAVLHLDAHETVMFGRSNFGEQAAAPQQEPRAAVASASTLSAARMAT